MCISDNKIVWIGILTGYQLIIGACTFWLAVLSRHITLKNFNTRGVALLSYFIGFTFAFGFPVKNSIGIDIAQYHCGVCSICCFVVY